MSILIASHTVKMSSYRPPHKRDTEPRKAEEMKKPKGEYAKLAEKWAVDDEVDRRMAEYKRLQEEADRRDAERIAARHAQRTRYARHDEEYDEEELAPTPKPAAGGSAFGDDEGWTEVKKKTRKPKRELTVEEMDERDRLREQAEKTSGEEFNGHLFDSNRHDHDRV